MRPLYSILAGVFFLSCTIIIADDSPTEESVGKIEVSFSDPKDGRIWRHPSADKNDFTLVLSGGGARGLSQIGVLEVFEEHDLHPSAIVGVSMGAIIGGLYSAGYNTSQLNQIVHQIEWGDLIYDSPKRTKLFQTQRMATERFLVHLRFLNFRPYIPEGISAANRISSLLVLYCAAPNFAANGDFDRLQIPFRAVTTDLRSGKPLIFSEGDLAVALRASSAIPLFLSPLEIDSILLADGGLLYPIPVEIAKVLSSAKIIAVDATADLNYSRALDNALYILDQTTNIMAEDKKKYERKLADILIEPDLGSQGSYDFDNIDSIIEIGKKAAETKLEDIKEILEYKDNNITIYTISSIDNGDLIGLISGNKISISTLKNKLNELYSQGIYKDVAIDYAVSHDTMNLQVHVELNPPLHGIKMVGVESFDVDTFISKFVIDTTQPANHREIDSLLSSIEDFYKSKGFDLSHIYFAAVDAGTLGIIFEEGLIEDIRIEGNNRTKDWVIRSFSDLEIGKKYQNRLLENTMSNIHATNLFESIIPRLERGDSGVVVLLELAEKPFLGIRLGARYDILNGVEGAVEIGDDNLFGIAWRLNFGINGGSRRWNIYSKIETDRIWRSFIAGNTTVFAKGTKYDLWQADTISETYDIYLYGIKLSLGQQIKRFGTLFLEIGSEYVVFGPEKSNHKEYPLNRFAIRSIVDTFDDRQFPRHGKYHESYFMISKDILGGEYSFSKSYASFQSYWTWTEALTFHPYVMGGYMSGGPPFFEQFELGQDVAFWGLRGDERRGNSFFKMGFNFRVNPMDPVYIFSGVTSGRTWQKDDKLELKETIWGWGAGWGIATPLGPLQLSWGTNTEKLQQINFSFGYNYD
ncbi:patatin-like phospholipase family protein [bacterium]|nr:patatin-like phospholipase family protein [bacterium]